MSSVRTVVRPLIEKPLEVADQVLNVFFVEDHRIGPK